MELGELLGVVPVKAKPDEESLEFLEALLATAN